MTAATPVDSLGAAPGRAWNQPAAEFRQWLAWSLVGLLVMAATLVVWRRLAGALLSPLQAPWLLCVAAVVVAVSLAARLTWPDRARGHRPEPLHRLVTVLPTAAVLALGAALCLRGTGVGGLLAFWTPVAAAECWAWQWMLRGQPARRRGVRWSPPPIPADPPEAPLSEPVGSSAAEEIPAELPGEATGENVLQRLTRSLSDDGCEELVGWLRAPFDAGQRTSNVHLAFCPPFLKAPELSVEQLDGPQTRIKTAQLLPHGARFDLKLGETASEPISVVLRFSARSRPGT